TLSNSGGPIVLDQDGPEIYATNFTIAPSPHEAGTIWVGSDDGLVHITRDTGRSWSNVSPPDLAPFSRVSRIDASRHRAGAAYVATKRYDLDDRRPYIWRTNDFGKTWTSIVSGIRPDDYVHVVREDPVRAGLLYAGAEHAVYVSLDDGARWQPVSLNLPDLQVSDLVVAGRDLVIATHGRSFWVLDDVSPLRQWNADVAASEAFLFAPAESTRRLRPALIDYWLTSPADSVTVDLIDARGQIARRLASALPRTRGLHRVTWDGRYTGAIVFPGIILEGGDPRRGPLAPPGAYEVRLTTWTDGRSVVRARKLDVRKDPRLTDVTDADLSEQFELAMRIRDATSTANEAVISIREISAQLADRARRAESDQARIRALAMSLADSLRAVESEIYQVRNQSSKDKIAFPIKLDDRLAGLRTNLERGDGPPPESYARVFTELSQELDVQLRRLGVFLERDLLALNARLAEAGLPAIATRKTVL
ncbi:MAG: glycosyl hydrolase, partial [Longimicrobiales bacterium]